jgi:hypothetical protein
LPFNRGIENGKYAENVQIITESANKVQAWRISPGLLETVCFVQVGNIIYSYRPVVARFFAGTGRAEEIHQVFSEHQLCATKIQKQLEGTITKHIFGCTASKQKPLAATPGTFHANYESSGNVPSEFFE